MASDSTTTSHKPKVAVLGAGSFGTAIANLISENESVYLFNRNNEAVEKIIATGYNHGQKMSNRVITTNDLKMVIDNSTVLFPMIPSNNCREFFKEIGPYLKPHHTIIHGTKGFDISKANADENDNELILDKHLVNTISQVIREETIVLKIGVIAGPNLSKEIADGQPAATVIASKFNSVINEGIRLLKSRRFQVFKSYDVVGVETAGSLKNIMAIGSGILYGLEYGDNARAMLISRGLNEIIRLGTILGGDAKTYLGVAGVGDLVATCSSNLSRNFTIGYWLAKGKPLQDILNEMTEVAEGIKTVMIAMALANNYNIRMPITSKIFDVLFHNLPVQKGIAQLMEYRNLLDVDFID